MSDAYARARAERRQGPPITHVLKTWPTHYGAVISGAKSFEVRKADRDFKVGDLLHLVEWDPDKECYTGPSAIRSVTYILPGGQFGIEAGYVVLGIR